MTNLQSDQQLDPIADLAAAFASDAIQQDGVISSQDSQRSVEPFSEDSRAGDGTNLDSRNEGTTDALASITLDELRAHSTLGPAIQSYVDQVAARQLAGKTSAIERQVREQVELEIAERHFKSLTREELADELASSPEAVVMYSKVTAAAAPPPDPEMTATLRALTSRIRVVSERLNSSGLPADKIASLDPKLHLIGNGDPDGTLTAYENLVHDAIIADKVAKAVAAATKTSTQSAELESQADLDYTDPLLEGGRNTPPLPDLNTRSELLLADAFARTERRRR